MTKIEQPPTPKRNQRLSPELAEVLKMLSALEAQQAPSVAIKSSNS